MTLPRLLRIAALCAHLALGGGCRPAEARSIATKYRGVNQTPFGQAFTALRKDAPSVGKALQLTLADASAYFGSEPQLKKAWQDAKGGRTGGATFTVDSNGTRLNGLISCEVGKPGTKIAVVVIRADAPAGEWERLVNPERGAQGGEAEGADGAQGGSPGHGLPAPANVRLTPHQFEDRTATIGLAEGWTTQSREAMKGVILNGPEDQAMSIGLMLTAQTPGSSLSRLPGSFVAPFTTPAEAIRALVPQINRRNAQAGGPQTALENIKVLATLKPTLQNGRSQLLRYGVSEKKRGGQSAHFQALAQIEITPVGPGAFMMSITALRAPDAIFDRDLPVMLQMLQSMRSDDAEINRRSAQNLANQQQWFKNQQIGQRAREAANYAHNQQYWQTQKDNAQKNKDWNMNQLHQSRRNDDFSEAMRGIRTVEDTRTGERKSADYLNVDKIVDDLNERDPGRYKQIPLRDELHPLDGQ